MIRSLLTVIIAADFFAYAQSADSMAYIHEMGSNNFLVSEEKDDSDFLDYFENFLEKPVNINSAGKEELTTVPFLSSIDAEKIINFRSRHGIFFSKAELFMIRSIPEERIKKILPFITVEQKAPPDQDSGSQIRINIKSCVRRKDLNSGGEISDWSNFNKLKISNGNKINAGFSTERDQGEKIFADYYSGFIQLNNFLLFNSVILGDYLIEEGQGLLLWSTFGMPKSSLVISSAVKKGKGFRVNTGTNETSFFRGIAAEKILDNFTFRGFFSCRRVDASVDTDGNIIKFLKDGYHRSSIEMERKNSVLSRTAGSSIFYNYDFLSIGSSFYITSFDKVFNGKSNIKGISVNSSLTFSDVYLFAEAALSYQSAVIAGIQITPVNELEFITLYRNYDPKYINLYSSGFGEKIKSTQNEKGLYTGLTLKTAIADINFFIDQYSFPYSESIENSKNGYDILIDAAVPLRKRAEVYLRYKYDSGDKLIASDETLNYSTKQRHNFRVEMKLDYGRGRVKLRCEYLKNIIGNNTSEDGFLTMQELRLDLMNWFSVSGRISFYSTDSYQSALFLYDSGFPGILESTALYGNGMMISSLIKILISKRISIHVKYSDKLMEKPFRKSTRAVMVHTAINY